MRAVDGLSARHVWQSDSQADPYEVITGATIDAALDQAKALNYGNESRGRSGPTYAETPPSAIRLPVVAGKIWAMS